MDKAEYVFEKLARYLSVDDVENQLGLYLKDNQEEVARQVLDNHIQNNILLRHPVLFSIPTFGGPGRAKRQAIREAIRKLNSQFPELDVEIKTREEQERQRKLDEYKLETERMKLTQAERTAKAVLNGALPIVDNITGRMNGNSNNTYDRYRYSRY